MNVIMRTIFSKTPLMVLAVAVLFAATAYRAQAAPGDLDQTFGTNGKVLTRFPLNSPTFRPRATPHAMVIQPDGKIVVAGHAMVGSGYNTPDAFALVRYLPNGSLDTGFGRGGRVTTQVGIQDAALAVALQPDGKIVAAGYANIGPAGSLNFAFALVRYNANGSLDRTFDFDGKVVTDLTTYQDELTGVAIQPDGKIVAAGFVNAGNSTDFAVARYNPNGSIDRTFGQTGVTQTDFFNGSIDGGAEMVLLPDGKIVVAGSVYDSAGAGDFALVRYTANGILDASFGNGGKVTTNFSATSSDIAHDMDIAPGGKLVVAGASGQPGKWDFAVARYNANGTLDRTFDGDGKFVRDISGFGTQDIAGGVAVQPNGKIVVSGDTPPFSNGGAYDLVTIRLNVNGSLDLGFGNRGKVYTDFGSFRPTGGYSHDSLSDVRIQRDGKIVVTGDAELEPNRTHDFVLARYLGDPVR